MTPEATTTPEVTTTSEVTITSEVLNAEPFTEAFVNISSATETSKLISTLTTGPTSTTSVTITSTTTSTSTTTTTPASYVYVFQAKPSPYFLSQLPPAQAVVSIPPTQYDPVRELLGGLLVL